jgi:GPI mannosyltransferase 3
MTCVVLNASKLIVFYICQSFFRDFRISLAWAALACIIRPTNALIWAFLGLHLIFKARSHIQAIIANTAAIL